MGIVSPMRMERVAEPPVYWHTAKYAKEHGESQEYKLSYQANEKCKEAIQQAINRHYDGSRLYVDAAVKEVLEMYGAERVQYLLANTVQHKSWDGRISPENKAWAKSILIPDDSCNAYLCLDRVHPGLMDLFLNKVRETIPKKITKKQQRRKRESRGMNAKMLQFTVEETNLIGIYRMPSRLETILELKRTKDRLADPILQQVAKQTMVKLAEISDKDFDAWDWSVAGE